MADSKETEESELEALEAEIQRLRDENAKLLVTNEQLRESEERFHQLAAASRDGVGITEKGMILEVNQRLEEMLGIEPGSGAGRRVIDHMAPGSRDEALAYIRSGKETPYEGEAQRLDGTTFPAIFHGKAITFRGRPARVTVIQDLSERKQAEAMLREAVQREALIQAQNETLAMLSVPLLPILDGVVLMPLIGKLNPERIQRVTEVLCTGVVEHTAHLAILDITGLLDVDAMVAEGITRAARAVNLLGARVVLTGVSPRVAAEMVRLDTKLEHITTLSTLARGVAYAARRWMSVDSDHQ